MNCPKCKAVLRGESAMLRQVNGGAIGTHSPGLTCWCCGVWMEQPSAPALVLTKEEMTPRQIDKRHIGCRKGVVVSVAAGFAATFYESIHSELKAGVSWRTIVNMIKQATGKRFDQKSLRKYYDLECSKRGIAAIRYNIGRPKQREVSAC